MSAVGLAVHGVSNRDRIAFDGAVADLEARAGPPVQLRPVFWGDLGPEGPLGAVPGALDAQELPLPPGAFEAVPEDLAEAARATADATLALLADTDAQTEADVRGALDTAARDGWSLALSADLAPVLADAVAAGPSPDEAMGAFDDWIKGRLTNIVKAVNGAIVDVLVREFRERQAGLGGTIAHTLGDVLVYQSLGPHIRGRLDEAYRLARHEGHEVDIVAHSLGALASVEWLMGASAVPSDGSDPTDPSDRGVRHLVTFGTQVSLFSELMGLRRGADDDFGAGPGPQGLSIQVTSWSNIWQELDPLAFVMSRVLHVDGAVPPPGVQDFRLTQRGIPTNLSFHSSYWRDDRFARWLASRLGA